MRLWLVLTAFFGNTMGFDAHGATVTAEVFGTYTRAGLTKVNEAVSNDGSASTGFRDDTMQIVTGDPLVTASAAIAARASADFNNGIVRSAASMSVTDRFNGAPTARGTARLEDTISFTGLTGGQSVSGRLSVLGSQQFTGRGNASASFSFRLFRPTASLAVVNDAFGNQGRYFETFDFDFRAPSQAALGNLGGVYDVEISARLTTTAGTGLSGIEGFATTNFGNSLQIEFDQIDGVQISGSQGEDVSAWRIVGAEIPVPSSVWLLLTALSAPTCFRLFRLKLAS